MRTSNRKKPPKRKRKRKAFHGSEIKVGDKGTVVIPRKGVNVDFRKEKSDYLDEAEGGFYPVEKSMKWECIKCGWCCQQNWRINMTWVEFDRLKDFLPIDKVAVHEPTGASHPYMEIRGDCPQYDKDKSLCKIYDIKCFSCSAFPFLLFPSGELFVCSFCRGVGKGSELDIDGKINELLKLKKEAGMIAQE